MQVWSGGSTAIDAFSGEGLPNNNLAGGGVVKAKHKVGAEIVRMVLGTVQHLNVVVVPVPSNKAGYTLLYRRVGFKPRPGLKG